MTIFFPKPRPRYYPFGSSLNTRSFSAGSGFRFGFNGKENFDKYQNYGMRTYYTDLGKFISVDPLAKSYPWNSTYTFAENDVIRAIDLDGLEKYIVTVRSFIPMATIDNPFYSPNFNSESFGGDNRNYYSVNNASYRTEQKVVADFDANNVVIQNNTASSSIGYDENGNVIETSASQKAGFIGYTPITEKSTFTTINFNVNASNSLVWGAPSINYNLAVRIFPSPNGKSFKYEVKGAVDGFPAYELWITDVSNKKSYLLLNRTPTESGEGPSSLFGKGEHNYNLKGFSGFKTPATKVNFKETQNSIECKGDDCDI